MNKRKEITRALTTKRYPVRGLDGKNAFLVIDGLREASIKLEKKFPEEFVGLSLIGSRVRGYATEKSDVEVGLISYGYSMEHYSKMSEIVSHALTRRGIEFDPLYSFPCVFDGIFFEGKPRLREAKTVAELFGLVSGRKINKLRYEVIKHIKTNLTSGEAKRFWSAVRKKYSELFLEYKGKGYQRLINGGVPRRKLCERREKFGLPSLEETEAMMRIKVRSTKSKSPRTKFAVKRDKTKIWRVTKSRRIK
ncbi:MAG: hypothetical protein ABIE23_05215 [archaeon]